MRILVLGLSLAITGTAVAGDCELSIASKDTFSTQMQRQEQVLRELVGVGAQIESLTGSTDWSKMDAIRGTLAAKERQRLDALLQRRKEFTLERLHETNRLRDVLVISRMATLSERLAQEDVEMPEDKQSMDYRLIGLLVAARELLPITFKQVASYEVADAGCSLELALAQAALRAAHEYSTLAPRLSDLKQLATRYGQPLDPEKMSAEDAARYREMLPIAQKAKAVATLSLDLARLASTEAASKLMLESMRADQNEAPGEVERAGSTWARWLQEGRIKDDQKEASNVIKYIYTHFPASTVFASTTGTQAQSQ